MKRKGTMSMDKLIVVILVILVLLLVLSFIFRGNILDMLRNIPGYTYNEEDREIEAPGADAVIIGQCSYRVAMVMDAKNIKFCGDERCTYGDLIDSKLLWKGGSNSDKEADLYVDQWANDKIGEVHEGRIGIYPDILRRVGDTYEEVRKDLPSFSQLINLDGSAYQSGVICRKEKVLMRTATHSNEMGIYLGSGDIIIARWNFETQKPEIIIRPLGKMLKREGKEVWVSDSESLLAILSENNVKKTLYLENIKTLLNPQKPSELSDAIRLLVTSTSPTKSFSYSETGLVKRDWNLNEINKWLYGGDPEKLFANEIATNA